MGTWAHGQGAAGRKVWRITTWTALLALLVVIGACEDPGATADDVLANDATAGQTDVLVAGTDVAATDAQAADAENDSLPDDAQQVDAQTDAAVDASADVSPVAPQCQSAADCPAPTVACTAATCVAGVCGTAVLQGVPCEDGDPCSQGDVCQAGKCSAGTTNLCPCKDDSDCPEDGNLCNGQAYCDQGSFPPSCKTKPGSAVTCSTANDDTCQKTVCLPGSGACEVIPVANAWLSCTSAGCTWTVAPPGLPAPAAALCDDGNPCTQNDVCSGKTCSAGANVCACTTNADCPDDGDACNGQPYCDKSGLIWSCKTNPASVVTCGTSADTPCAKSQCDPQSGDCKPVPTEVLTGGPVACSDGNSCTSGDQCQGGTCVAGTETCKCQSDADCDNQEDGNACNGTLFCNKASGACQLNPATVVVCPTVDDTNCGHNVCYPKSGLCQLAPVEVTEQVCTGTDCRWQLLPPGSDAGEITACDDGNSCTVGEKCSGGACIASVDTCLCQNDSDCAKFDDGDACNGTQYCNLLEQKCALNPASIVPCQTVGDTACLQNACEPTTGQCSPTPVGKVATVCVDLPGGKQCVQEVKADAETLNLPCDDGNACTEGDTCQAGQCQSGAKVCLCQTDSDCLAGEDGDRCNGTLYCDKLSGDCKLNPATVIACASGQNTTCQKNACHPVTGQCLATPTELTREVCDADKCLTEVDLSGDLTVTLGCEDGEPCTTGDLCNGGQCQPGVFTCACNTTADCAKKEDGNVCNGTLFCDKSVFGNPQCALNPATILTCPASTVPCGVAACDPSSGACSVVPGNDGKPCDDGTLCTEADACSGGQCSGLAVDCNDNNACTNDACQSGIGCVHVGKSCDDGNVCTQDGCDGQTGQCTADTLAKDGAFCNADASGCTVNDFCAAGTCKSGAPIACSQPSGPCEQAVCVPQGELG